MLNSYSWIWALEVNTVGAQNTKSNKNLIRVSQWLGLLNSYTISPSHLFMLYFRAYLSFRLFCDQESLLIMLKGTYMELGIKTRSVSFKSSVLHAGLQFSFLVFQDPVFRTKPGGPQGIRIVRSFIFIYFK